MIVYDVLGKERMFITGATIQFPNDKFRADFGACQQSFTVTFLQTPECGDYIGLLEDYPNSSKMIRYISFCCDDIDPKETFIQPGMVCIGLIEVKVREPYIDFIDQPVMLMADDSIIDANNVRHESIFEFEQSLDLNVSVSKNVEECTPYVIESIAK